MNVTSTSIVSGGKEVDPIQSRQRPVKGGGVSNALFRYEEHKSMLVLEYILVV